MKFFTPQLYQQFNSANAEEADRANEQWEQAIRDYQKHLNEIRDRMSTQVSKLSELDLHDAEILARVEESQAVMFHEFPFPFPLPLPFWTAVAVVSVTRDGEILSLIYSLWDRLREREAPAGWRFSKLRVHWLYDELDMISGHRGGAFLHRILLSDGTVLEIPFLTVLIHRFPLPALESNNQVRESA